MGVKVRIVLVWVVRRIVVPVGVVSALSVGGALVWVVRPVILSRNAAQSCGVVEMMGSGVGLAGLRGCLLSLICTRSSWKRTSTQDAALVL